MRSLIYLTAFAGLASVGAAIMAQEAAGPSATAEQDQFFEERVRPLLAQRCWECHGEEVQESDLRLDSHADLLSGGSSGQALVVAGRPEESYLLEVVQHTGDVQMPPDEKLPDEDIEAVRQWIAAGAHWPAGPDGVEPTLTKEERLARQLEQHWSFQPLREPPVPSVRATDWVTGPLDPFILARLENRGLTPSSEADRYTLIRRLKFDLLGLPPTAEEVIDFVNDTDPRAYETLVESFLSSPRYGERWGRHWLDVARYADTKGYAFDRDRRYPFAYTYRDYVIQALNDDMPFDQFVLRQLAADLLAEEANDPHLAALGFLTVGRKYNNRHLDIDDQIDVVGRGLLGLTVSCARCHDHKYDPIPTEDYYSLYGVFASSSEPRELPIIGNPEQTPGYAEYKQELDRRQGELDAFKAQKRDEFAEVARRHAVDYLARAITQEAEPALQERPFIHLKGEEFKPQLVQRWQRALAGDTHVDDPVLGPLYELALVPNDQYATRAEEILQKWQGVSVGTQRGELNPLVRDTLAGDPPLTKLELARVYGTLFSHLYAAQRDASPAETASSAPQDPAASAATDAQQDAGRGRQDEAIAQILAILTGPGSLTDISLDEAVGMMTRADRNRYRELERNIETHQADSPGSPPRAMVVAESATPHNPKVFIRGNPARPGEDVPRQFLRALAGSERQPFASGSGRLELAQAIVAADNPLTARVIVNRVWQYHFGTPLVNTPSDFGLRSDRPIQADTLDYLASHLTANNWSLKALHRAIVLSSTYRQASVRRADCEAVDPENTLYWRMNPRRLEFEAMRDAMLAVTQQLDLTTGGRPVDLIAEPYSRRRSVYGYIDRQDLPGLFRVFDMASPDQSCPQRPRTTVPQQGLFFLNSPFVIQCAQRLATLPGVASAAEQVERITRLYRAVLSRDPTPRELEIGRQFLASGLPMNTPGDTPDILQQYCQVLLMSNAFMFVD